MQPSILVEQILVARQIADYANRLGVERSPMPARAASHHLGAVLADAVLQAGVNYQSVVRARIERIESRFPDTATLHGVVAVIERGEIHDFLLWKHPTKVMRFTSLAELLATQHIQTTHELREWLYLNVARQTLLRLNGVGPKTCDYLSCLVGIDCIAVDRHIRAFAVDAGVAVKEYEYLKLVVSYAADLLGIKRRDFDAWIWRTVSGRSNSGCHHWQ